MCSNDNLCKFVPDSLIKYHLKLMIVLCWKHIYVWGFFFVLLWQRFVQHEYLLKLFKLLNIFHSAPSLIFLQFVLLLSTLEQEYNFVKIQTLFHGEKKISHERLSKQCGLLFFVCFGFLFCLFLCF